MRPRSVISGLAFAASLVLGGLSGVVHASEPADDTPVVVAEDKTIEADCVQWEGTPENQKPGMLYSLVTLRIRKSRSLGTQITL